MLGIRGKVQCESAVIHIIVEHLRDLSDDLTRISGLDTQFRRIPAAEMTQSGVEALIPRGEGCAAQATRRLRADPSYRQPERPIGALCRGPKAHTRTG
jgi:hypothetical protein